jgi:hypothetical protein
MAGLPLGITFARPLVPATVGGAAVFTSRTRRCVGVLDLGTVLAAVFASRRQDDERGVSLALGLDGQAVTARMTPAQARTLARSLIEAAAAVDQAQRQLQFTRGEVCHG